MSNIGSYSRHRMLGELASPLYSSTVGGNTYFLTPDEQRAQVLTNLNTFDAAPSTITVTTSGTTSKSGFKSDGISNLVTLTLTSFSLGTAGDAAALGIGASLVSFPTGTLIENITATGTFSVVGNDYTNAMDVGFGTTIASGAVSVLGGTAAFENVMAGQTTGSLAASGSNSIIAVTLPNGSDPAAKTIRLITSSPGLAIFFNAAATWTNVATAGALTFTGTVTIKYR